MAWLLIITSLLVLWIASLCKILHQSYTPRVDAFLSDKDGGAFRKRRVLLVIAHPDDESMFFSPMINYLISKGHQLHILCLSTGNADGMGKIRSDELYQACAVLKVPLQQVKVLDDLNLQDGFGLPWNHDLVAKIVEEEIISRGIDTIVTFDNYGVSGHCNHRDVHYGVRKLLNDTSQNDIEGWELVTTSIFRKYSGPVDTWLSILYANRHPGGVMHCLINEHPKKSFAAMAQHASQWVPEAFCITFQLYLHKFSEEDQHVTVKKFA
ncbi:hypothetical protein ACFE04_005602 [Oxalis oulophora]